MSIRDVLTKRLDSIYVNRAKALLRPGQIVQGKVVKLYPNNKAQIHLGSQKMVAQLEASLTIGEKYHFQVKSNDDVTYLKVIGEQLKPDADANMRILLQELGMKATKTNLSLMEQVMKDKVPFDRDELMKAFQLLEGSKGKEQARLVIKEMLTHKLPLTDSIFQALYTKATNGFTDQLRGFLQQLRQDTNHTPLKKSLIESLSSLIRQPVSNKGILSKYILSEIDSNQKNLFIMTKSTGLVNKNIDFSTWKSEWQTFAKSNPVSPLPFQLNTSEVLHVLKQVASGKDGTRKQSQVVDQLFTTLINKANIQQVPLSDGDFTELKTLIESNLLPLLSGRQQQQIRTLLVNNQASLEQLQTQLKTLSTEQTYAQIESILRDTNINESMISKPNEMLLTQIKRVLKTTGLAHEFYLANDLPEKQSATIKSMLIQFLQQGDGATNEGAQQLLHFINGQQIQSVTDTTNFLHVSIQIPGENFSLNKDLQLEFQGRKTESGTIDPAYCRILFYLDLTNLKETIVDMHIQKRAVAVTIFNDNDKILEHSPTLKPMLKHGLSALDYHLSTISVKPLKRMDMDKKNLPQSAENNSCQGVDYRI